MIQITHLRNNKTTIVRPLVRKDKEEAIRLVTEGFYPRHQPGHFDHWFLYAWMQKVPHYGFALIHDEKIVGVFGAIFSEREYDGRVEKFCNMTSWYVVPAYRGAGLKHLMAFVSLAPEFTLTNLTAPKVVVTILRGINLKYLNKINYIFPTLCNINTLFSNNSSILSDPKELRCYLNSKE